MIIRKEGKRGGIGFKTGDFGKEAPKNRLKHLLILSTRYPHKHDDMSSTYVHSQVEELRKYFERVSVVSTMPYTPRLFLRWMVPQRTLDSLAADYSYENVQVFFTKNIILPVKPFSEWRGESGYKAVMRIIKRENIKPDIVHCHFSWPCGYIGARLRGELAVPVVLTAHENREWFLKEEKNPKITWAWRNVDAIIRVNKKDASVLKKYNINVQAIPNGFLHNKFKPLDQKQCRKRLGLPLDKKVTFSLGRLIERKGFQDLVHAVDLITRSRDDILAFIGGHGPMKSRLESMIAEKGLKKHVQLLSCVSNVDVPVWMNAADVFIHPSYSESFGLVQLEALACGTPVVATINGGSEEIIIDARLGHLVNPGDIEALTEAILFVLDQQPDRNFMRDYCRDFTWRKISSKIVRSLYLGRSGTQ